MIPSPEAIQGEHRQRDKGKEKKNGGEEKKRLLYVIMAACLSFFFLFHWFVITMFFVVAVNFVSCLKRLDYMEYIYVDYQ